MRYCDVLGLAPFTQLNVWDASTTACIDTRVPFYSWMLLHWTERPRLDFSFFVRWTFELFLYLGSIVHTAAMNIRVQGLVWVFSVLWGVFQLLRLAGSHGNPASFEQLADFSTAAASFSSPISDVWGFQFLHVLPNPNFPLPDYSYPIECEVVSCGLDWHFPYNWLYLFKSLLAIYAPPLEMCLFKSSPIVIAMFVLLLLSSKSPLYILDTGP